MATRVQKVALYMYILICNLRIEGVSHDGSWVGRVAIITLPPLLLVILWIVTQIDLKVLEE